MDKKVNYNKCRNCKVEFTQPINQGRVWAKNDSKIPTIVVDGYCFDYCMKLGEQEMENFKEFIKDFPQVEEAFKKYEYFKDLRTSAIMLD